MATWQWPMVDTGYYGQGAADYWLKARGQRSQNALRQAQIQQIENEESLLGMKQETAKLTQNKLGLLIDSEKAKAKARARDAEQQSWYDDASKVTTFEDGEEWIKGVAKDKKHAMALMKQLILSSEIDSSGKHVLKKDIWDDRMRSIYRRQDFKDSLVFKQSMEKYKQDVKLPKKPSYTNIEGAAFEQWMTDETKLTKKQKRIIEKKFRPPGDSIAQTKAKVKARYEAWKESFKSLMKRDPSKEEIRHRFLADPFGFLAPPSPPKTNEILGGDTPEGEVAKLFESKVLTKNTTAKEVKKMFSDGKISKLAAKYYLIKYLGFKE